MDEPMELLWLKRFSDDRSRVIRRVWISVEWKPEDLWIGAFWKNNGHANRSDLHIWICLLPCIPIHIQIAGQW